jgi:hypothetical protein
MRNHPDYAAGLLSRMDGWEAAAEMVAQHHEMPDGKGYPEGSPPTQICDGAKILAIVDAFEAVMLKHAIAARTARCCAPSPKSMPATTSSRRNGSPLQPGHPPLGESMT